MYTGFSMATRAGLSIAVDDMLVPQQKDAIIAEAEKEVQEIEKQYTSASSRRASATTRWSTSGGAPGISSPRP
jgi:DNA-directed RNA polymerase beta' subunit